MRFARSRKFYIFITFGFVLILFFFSHWKTFMILDENNDNTFLHKLIRMKNLRNGGSEMDDKMKDEKCRSQNGVQILGHCMNKAVLGVAPSDMVNYRPNPMSLFACFDGELSVTWSSVNDDYCDCDDGSDEPGTGACPNTRFYCVGQQLYLPSSRINDGICDCCDGSDEWKKQTVRGDVLQKHNFNVKYAPCENVC